MSKKSTDSDTHKHVADFGGIRSGRRCLYLFSSLCLSAARQTSPGRSSEALSGCPEIVLSPFTVIPFPRLVPPPPTPTRILSMHLTLSSTPVQSRSRSQGVSRCCMFDISNSPGGGNQKSGGRKPCDPRLACSSQRFTPGHGHHGHHGLHGST